LDRTEWASFVRGAKAAISKKNKNTNKDKNKKIFHAENTLLLYEKILCQNQDSYLH
jgi:hypothetical protein